MMLLKDDKYSGVTQINKMYDKNVFVYIRIQALKINLIRVGSIAILLRLNVVKDFQDISNFFQKVRPQVNGPKYLIECLPYLIV